jgi:hypothetical protein
MAAGKYNLLIEQGDTFTHTFTYYDDNKDIIDLTGYSALLTIKSSLTGGSTILTASTSTDYLTLSGSSGRLQLVIPNTITSTLSSSGVYTCDITSSSGIVTRILEGNVNISLSANQ